VRTQVHLRGAGGFSSTYYWSSTERDAAQVYYSSFSNRGPTSDGAGYAAKGNNWYLRPVRRFSFDSRSASYVVASAHEAYRDRA
jgi:hypothetical protein